MANNANKMVCNREQNHRKESINHVKTGENETRRKLKTKESM
ncbi:hypothetical protein [Leptospira noguchii]|nr:hypothetical protein [Leptospira noguchii]EMS88028.1 hypothetical protein LEP1GSC073_4118 [Leptospira noguchii str. Cascata]